MARLSLRGPPLSHGPLSCVCCQTCGQGFVLRTYMHTWPEPTCLLRVCVVPEMVRQCSPVPTTSERSAQCLLRAPHLFPPLSYEQILTVEAEETQAQKRLSKVSGLAGRLPRHLSPVDPECPQPPNALPSFQTCVLCTDPQTDAVLAWISEYVEAGSTEEVRVTAKRFWQCRPKQFHQNSLHDSWDAP